jgi:hypothetical protein
MTPKAPDPVGEAVQNPPDHAEGVASGFDQPLALLGLVLAPKATNSAFGIGASDALREPMQRSLSRWLILQTTATYKRD